VRWIAERETPSRGPFAILRDRSPPASQWSQATGTGSEWFRSGSSGVSAGAETQLVVSAGDRGNHEQGS
jgi:hypothetical protein